MINTIISKVMNIDAYSEFEAHNILLNAWWKFYRDEWNDPDWMESELTSLGLDFDKDFQMFWNKQWNTNLEDSIDKCKCTNFSLSTIVPINNRCLKCGLSVI